MNDNNEQQNQNQGQQELQVQIPPEIQKGVYANNMVVSHTQEEFVIDFILATPPVGSVNARVIVSPSHAKRIAKAMAENVAKYEARFGQVEDLPPVAVPSGIKTH